MLMNIITQSFSSSLYTMCTYRTILAPIEKNADSPVLFIMKLTGKTLNEDGVADLQTPLLDTAKSSRFINVANIPFNLEDSPQTADGTTEGNGTNTNGEGSSKETENDGGDSGSCKRTIIDLDDYYEKPAVAKRNKVIQVKLEPKD
ncbi:hypothetical protein Tco_0209825 [Tanacetum coccineum]